MRGVERAQRILDAARARHAGIATPGWVTSPMDTSGTVTLSAAFIASCEPGAAARRRPGSTD
ncbi:hypothetical protein [Nakamurella endophytica]|uniref:Uncharacterized protein n=1 Tax=Nakamurella endophytica TaxID=1748367 RepID=A0A917SXN4_9ACTN|nr:hypothetical protein [Nakamurella endophytica]GGM01404.1 hypothetical protein GCM10011594_21860 [Nakamurella endophytica]